jgi:Ankyrin repeats (3 copies)
MGLFCVNFHVRSAGTTDVTSALKNDETRDTLVLPEKNGWTSFYEKLASHQDEARIVQIGKRVSAGLERLVVAFLVHDSDIACYWLFENGTQVDSYNSCPDYFSDSDADEEHTGDRGGDPELLLRHCRPGTTLAEIQSVLDSDSIFAEQIIEQVAALLGIPEARAISDYRDIADGDNPDDFTGPDFDGGGGGDDGAEGPLDSGSLGSGRAEVFSIQEFVNRRLKGAAGPEQRGGNSAKRQETAERRFLAAAASGDIETLEQLLVDGVAPDAVAEAPAPRTMASVATMFPGGLPAMTGLMAAVLNGQANAARWLLARGASPDLDHFLFGSPVHAAATAGKPEVLQVLIEHGADVQRKTPHGLSALQIIGNTRSAWSKINTVHSSLSALGIKLPGMTGMTGQTPDMAKMESGWAACEKLLRELQS